MIEQTDVSALVSVVQRERARLDAAEFALERALAEEQEAERAVQNVADGAALNDPEDVRFGHQVASEQLAQAKARRFAEEVRRAKAEGTLKLAQDALAAAGWDLAAIDSVLIPPPDAVPMKPCEGSVETMASPLRAPLELIGKGTYGHVYRSVDQRNRAVAVKFIHVHRAEETSAIGHAWAMAKARHPAMVDLYDVRYLIDPETRQEAPALIMEWIDGASLELRTEPIALADAERCAKTVVSFLRRLRQAGTHHGDLHAGNVMISRGELRILDPYHRTSQQIQSTRSEAQWQLDDAVQGWLLIDALFRRVDGAAGDAMIVAFRTHKPRSGSLDDLDTAVGLALRCGSSAAARG